MGVDDTAVLIAVAVWIVFVTLGCVLLTWFWARRLSVMFRALVATGAGALLLLVPLIVIGDAGDEAMVILLGGAAMIGIIAFPVAFLATRKLERQFLAHSQDIGAIFD